MTKLHVVIFFFIVLASVMEALFNEELGWVLEVAAADVDAVTDIFKAADVLCHVIGQVKGFGKDSQVCEQVNGGLIWTKLSRLKM